MNRVQVIEKKGRNIKRKLSLVRLIIVVNFNDTGIRFIEQIYYQRNSKLLPERSSTSESGQLFQPIQYELYRIDVATKYLLHVIHLLLCPYCLQRCQRDFLKCYEYKVCSMIEETGRIYGYYGLIEYHVLNPYTRENEGFLKITLLQSDVSFSKLTYFRKAKL